jgi:hypothetical protein
LPTARRAASTLSALRSRSGRALGRLGVAIDRRNGTGRKVKRVPRVLRAIIRAVQDEPKLVCLEIPPRIPDLAPCSDSANRALHSAHELSTGNLFERRIRLREGWLRTSREHSE